MDSDGEVRLTAEHKLVIQIDDDVAVQTPSRMTFVTVKQGSVRRIVYNPMPTAADLGLAIRSLKPLFLALPDHERQLLEGWAEDIIGSVGSLDEDVSSLTTGCDVNDREVFVELKRMPDSAQWYTTVRLYIKP